MPETTIPLSFVVEALLPPDTVTTVAEYQAYLKDLFGTQQQQPKEQPKRGRPIAVTHPLLTQDDLADVMAIVKEDPDGFKSASGRPARRLHNEQPNDATMVRLDNDVYAQKVFEEWMPYEQVASESAG